ncbi:MAG: terminase family protein [candidate division Zixibacteria bacterium]|nr:terminase family protein [candidate division Zixibacteria bacterium]
MSDALNLAELAAWKRGVFDLPFFAKQFLGLDLHNGQRLWLAGSIRRENLLVTGNRWGKSFVSALKLLHHAIYRYRPRKYDPAGIYRSAVVSITQNQADLVLLHALRMIYRSAQIKPMVKTVLHSPFPRIILANDATIESRTTQNRGEHLLGNDYDLVIYDEVAFDPFAEHVVEEVLMMRLADREGRLDLVSTPNGKNWLYRRAAEIVDGKRMGYFQRGDSRDNLHISRDYLDERVRYFSDSRLKQNIMGQFVDSGGEIIRGKDIDLALARINSLPPLDPNERYRFISGWDLARKRTATVGITICLQDGIARVVALERFKLLDWPVILERIKLRQQQYPGQLVIDGTGLGDVIAQQLEEYNPTSVVFTPTVKAELLTNVELMHARGIVAYDRWELPDGVGKVWSLEDELRSGQWDDNNECDSLMALALALKPLAVRSSPLIPPRVARI